MEIGKRLGIGDLRLEPVLVGFESLGHGVLFHFLDIIDCIKRYSGRVSGMGDE